LYLLDDLSTSLNDLFRSPSDGTKSSIMSRIHSTRFLQGDSDNSGIFPAEATLRLYAYRCIDALPCDEVSIGFYLSVLSEAEVLSLIGFIREHASTKADSSTNGQWQSRYLVNSILSRIYENQDGFSPRDALGHQLGGSRGWPRGTRHVDWHG